MDIAASELQPRSITVLGATGSVGESTLDLIARNPASYQLKAITGHHNVNRLIEQCLALKPDMAVIAADEHYQALKEGLSGTDIEVGAGSTALLEAAQAGADWTMSAIVGAAGLEPTLEAVRAGSIVALANKESLVCAGELMMREVQQRGTTLLPVDSEHNAIAQVFDRHRPEAVRKLILTASGGPFRTWSRADMATVTPAQAVAHPNWSMGAKISVDSATMMNKGLELIEAFHLFPVTHDQIDILVHPESIIHSMVDYVDGSVLAQLGSPDMRTPIAYALAWPARMETPTKQLDLAEVASLHFEAPDPERFPALSLAREAVRRGGSAPTILNAANEIAVAAFLAGQVGFLDIPRIAEHALGNCHISALDALSDVRHIDQEARRVAQSFAAQLSV